MDRKIRIYPAKGLRIPLPGGVNNREYVPEEGMEVSPSPYFLRLLRNKDIALSPSGAGKLTGIKQKAKKQKKEA